MKKRFFWTIALIGLSWASAIAQRPVSERTGNYQYKFYVRNDVPPAPLTAGDTRASWANFWMFKDGFFSQQSIIERQFGAAGPVNVQLARRGRYTGEGEPPHQRVSLTLPSGGDNNTPPHILPHNFLNGDTTNKIVLQWHAARQMDTVCIALIVRTNSDAPGGTIKFRFPSESFDWAGQVFPDQPGFTFDSRWTDGGDVNYPSPGTVYSWTINSDATYNVQERVLFVKLRVKDTVRDSTVHNVWLDWSSGTSLFSGVIKSSSDGTAGGRSEATPAGKTFRATTRAAVDINFARDPNALYVEPEWMAPARHVPPQKITYTFHVENLGTAPAENLRAVVFLDKRLDPASMHLISSSFPSAPGLVITPIWKNDQVLSWELSHVFLQPSHGEDAATNMDFTKGEFSFEIFTRDGIDLVEGRHIEARGKVYMLGKAINRTAGAPANLNTAAIQDSVWTNPAIVRIESRCVGRIPFGSVFGVKAQLDLAASGEPNHQKGLGLTWRFPLHNPCGNSLGNQYLQFQPKWFWQLELGLGGSNFEIPATGQRYETQQVHFSPAQVRYYQRIASNSWLSWLNISAGYSADYTYRLARPGGGQAPLPAKFGNRLEHSLFATVGVSNKIGVPSYNVGIGYQQRFNRLAGPSIDYGLPFVFLQVDIIRLRRHWAQVWTHIYEW